MFDVLELDLTLEQASNIPRCLLLTAVLQCKRAASLSHEEDTAMACTSILSRNEQVTNSQ